MLLTAIGAAASFPLRRLHAATRDPSTPLVFVTNLSRDKGPNAPILFLMHGFGSDETDLMSMASSFPPALTVVSLRAPYAAPDSGYQWYDNRASDTVLAAQLARSRALVDASITQLTQRFRADPQRIFIGGFSQGANLTYAMTIAQPDRYRGGLVFSGKVLPPVSNTMSSAPDASKLFLFIGHGTADTVIPFAYADNAAMALRERHVNMTFDSYAGMGHEVGRQELSDAAAWLSTRL